MFVGIQYARSGQERTNLNWLCVNLLTTQFELLVLALLLSSELLIVVLTGNQRNDAANGSAVV